VGFGRPAAGERPGRHLFAITNYWYFEGMSSNTSISLDEHSAAFLAREVTSGRFRTASEAVRAGLRLLEDQETHLAALRASLADGESSGTPEPFDLEAFIAEKKG
jgi:antitoxin ParD1/3/4